MCGKILLMYGIKGLQGRVLYKRITIQTEIKRINNNVDDWRLPYYL